MLRFWRSKKKNYPPSPSNSQPHLIRDVRMKKKLTKIGFIALLSTLLFGCGGGMKSLPPKISESTTMHVAEQIQRERSKDDKGFTQNTFDIQWGDSAKKIKAMLGRPSESGPKHGQWVLEYRYGKEGGSIRFFFGPDGKTKSRRKSTTDGLSTIYVLPKNPFDMSVIETATLIRMETSQTLPQIGKAEGFLGDFLQAKGFKSINPSLSAKH